MRLRAVARRQRGERLAVDLDAAFRRHKAGERAHQRGLAGAVRPDQHGELAGAQIERRAVDDQRIAEAHHHVAGVPFFLAMIFSERRLLEGAPS